MRTEYFTNGLQIPNRFIISSLETSGKLMELEQKKGTLRVNYSDRLVRLLREVRQLNSLGYSIPLKIQQCARNGEKFYKSAIILKQVSGNSAA